MSHEEKISSGKKYIWFDFIRGISAIIVFLSHAKASFFVDYQDLTSKGAGAKFFYFISGIGHEAVMVFFVLSGFFVGGSILKKKDSFKWGGYLIARLSRLWVVLIPALILTLCFDFTTRYLDHSILQGFVREKWHSGPDIAGSADAWSVSIKTFFGNLFFLQTIACPVYGTNGPLWSLTNEFWYYMLFPLGLKALGILPNKAGIERILSGIAIICICLLAPKILFGALIWLMGVVIWKIEGRWSRLSLKIPQFINLILPFLLLGLVAGCIALSKLKLVNNTIADLSIGLSFSCLALVIASLQGRFTMMLATLAKGLSNISFSLYLFHFPALVLCAVYFNKAEQQQLTFNQILRFSGVISLVLAGAVLFWWCFESRTAKIRDVVVRLFD